MFIKLKGENHYHFCREHIEELGRLDELKKPDQLSDRRYADPEDEKICEECQALAEKGGCTTFFVQIGSHFEET
ncbi:MAG: hypothetical protein ABEJ25_03105 [Candidatus Bipolaricaulia bacterium]